VVLLEAARGVRLSSFMTHTRFTSLADTLPASVPFVGPETQERQRGAPFQARLGANESIFGPSPQAIQTMRDCAADVWMYGDPESHELRHALAAHHQIEPENIIIGEGIDGLLGYLVRLLIEPQDTVVTTQGAYPTFNYHVAGFGGVLHTVPYDAHDKEDPDALFAKAADVNAKLVYLANPDNPMGSWHSGEDVARSLEKLPKGTLLLLDEATSALDAESEFHVQNALQAVTHGRTTLVIAHRLSTVEQADHIVVLDSGSVVATGTHTQLLERSEHYRRLHRQDFVA